MKKAPQQGFTLLEILMALVFIALPFAAIMQTMSNYVYDTGYLREKTLAHWVAMNKLTEIQVTREWPNTGTKTGKTIMAGEEWRWQTIVNSTPEPNMRRVDIDVFALDSNDSVITSLTSYIGQP